MPVEYDLVVVGSTAEGIYAAQTAARLQARVALVTQSDRQYLRDKSIYSASLANFSPNYQANSYASWLEWEKPLISNREMESKKTSLVTASNWVDFTNSAIDRLNSLSSLASLGVDIIVGKGEFYRLPQLGLKVKNRDLRSRRFLLATGSVYNPSSLDLQFSEACLTWEDLIAGKLKDLPQNLAIIGGNPLALELTQTLTKFGKKISLVIPELCILPQEDREISNLITAKLEAEGIEIFTNATISQIKIIDGRKWLQAGDRALSVDEIIFADRRQPRISGLNLAGVGVKYDKNKVYVDAKLTTTNPKIYACGDLIGGYSLPNLARYEVNLILKNSLFFPWYRADYHTVPWSILTNPSLARVGWTETKAKQQHRDKIYTIRQYFNQTTQGVILDSNPGLCKLVVSAKGKILGCTIVGDRAAELIAIPTLMMQQKINLDSNPLRGLTSQKIPTISPSLAEVFEKAIADYYCQKIKDDPKLINRLRSWFSWRRK